MPPKARWFPLFQEIAGREALVIGGGTVALRRVQSLLLFDCHIHIISPQLCAGLEETAGKNTAPISVEYREFEKGDCTARTERPFCVIAATSSREVNSAVGRECTAQGIPVSVADRKEEASFYFPAIVMMDGNVTIALNSGGADHRAVKEAARRLEAARSDGTG